MYSLVARNFIYVVQMVVELRISFKNTYRQMSGKVFTLDPCSYCKQYVCLDPRNSARKHVLYISEAMAIANASPP